MIIHPLPLKMEILIEVFFCTNLSAHFLFQCEMKFYYFQRANNVIWFGIT